MTSIKAENLRKVYRLYESPMQRLKEIVFRRPYHTEFIALDNINFSTSQGETFGVIGENGAGKSTLLKILAKTLNPTSGELIINGRSAALLELGAGFNPELTGEENMYLNAYLMGLSKSEINMKRQEIIDFSELGDFINRPVKTYSSGMHVRLAFSIATSVDPEILIVDEALSVGDEHFQKKCIDRMMNFRDRGKTILFCSHSMYQIQELCSTVMWLHKGEVKNIGDTGKVITDYQNFERGRSAALKEKVSDIIEQSDSVDEKAVRIKSIRILDEGGSETESLNTFEPVTFSFRIRCGKSNIKGHIGFAVIRNDEVMCFGTMTGFDNLDPIHFRDDQEFQVRLKSLQLLSGLYSIAVIVSDESGLHPYDVLRTKNFSLTHGTKEFGMTYIDHEWII
jgi:ABC-type polysaccharide/polyol phosphate transport system ATPase subunit